MIKWIEYLNACTEYDELIDDMAGIPFSYRIGNLSSMKWFLEHGARGNRFRKSYDKLIDACMVGVCAIEEMKEINAY